MVYAGFWRRFAALMIDGLIVLIPSMALAWVLPYIGGLVAMFLYRPFFESSEIRGTPGKLFMGLQVTNEEGGRLTFAQAMSRWLLSIVSGMMMGLGYAFNLFTPKRQCFHDLMVGSVVQHRQVSTNVDWVGIWTREFKRVFNIDQPPRTGSFDVTGTISPRPDEPSWTSSGPRPVPAGTPLRPETPTAPLRPEPTFSSPTTPVEAATPPMDAATAMSMIDQLHRLFQAGALSEAEFNAKKEELLRRV